MRLTKRVVFFVWGAGSNWFIFLSFPGIWHDQKVAAFYWLRYGKPGKGLAPSCELRRNSRYVLNFCISSSGSMSHTTYLVTFPLIDFEKSTEARSASFLLAIAANRIQDRSGRNAFPPSSLTTTTSDANDHQKPPPTWPINLRVGVHRASTSTYRAPTHHSFYKTLTKSYLLLELSTWYTPQDGIHILW